ncbi:MAG: DUF2189 domain-containing protein [Arenicella sp.]|nr:DUF2189 domain-containing protein [Arenicella sp.]
MNTVDKNTDPLPFVAPCIVLPLSAPWRWLKLGFKDASRAPLVSFGSGAVMSGLIMAVTVLAWQYGSVWIMFSLLCGFVFIAPIACVGTYAISAQLERGMKVSFKRTLRACFKQYISTELVFALVLLVIFLVWARASSMASIFLPNSAEHNFDNMVTYLSILALVAVLFLSITFAASVFSLPMIMHRDVDAITAVVTSVNAVMRNKLVMLLWGWLIAAGLFIGMATLGVALVFFLPAVGHAVWHGYLETIDASQFPRHQVGITATARPPHER